LNASGWAPAGLTPDLLKRQGISKMPQHGIHSVTVPGAVDDWDKLVRRFGRKRLGDLLAPTIRYAELGFPVSEIFASYWSGSETNIKRDPGATKTYLPSGHAPRTGHIFRNPYLAWSLREIAAHGRKAFYEGAIAKKLLAFSQGKGGTLAADDLA